MQAGFHQGKHEQAQQPTKVSPHLHFEQPSWQIFCALMAALTSCRHATVCCVLVAAHSAMPTRPSVHFHGFWVNALVSLKNTSRLMKSLPRLGWMISARWSRSRTAKTLVILVAVPYSGGNISSECSKAMLTGSVLHLTLDWSSLGKPSSRSNQQRHSAGSVGQCTLVNADVSFGPTQPRANSFNTWSESLQAATFRDFWKAPAVQCTQ